MKLHRLIGRTPRNGGTHIRFAELNPSPHVKSHVWADVRVPYAFPILGMLVAAVCALVLYLARRFDFYWDEWTVILFVPRYSIPDYFVPHNEHWSTIPFLVYRFWFAVVGTGTLVPYLGTLLVVHALIAVELFLLVRRRAGELLGLTAAALVLFLGRGWEDIIWPFQVSFAGSVALGLLAMLLLDRPGATARRVVLASAALILSLMCSGVGLFFCAAIGVELLLDTPRRRYLLVLIAPALVYATWYAAFGAKAIAVHRSPFTPSALLSLREYLPLGLGTAVAGLVSLSGNWSSIALAALAAFVGARIAQLKGVEPRVAGAAAGLLVQYGLVGLVRGQFGVGQAGTPRYIHVAAVFLLLLVTPLIRDLRWRQAWSPAFAALITVVLVHNSLQLRAAAHDRNAHFTRQQAELRTVLAFREAPGLDRDARIDDSVVPGATVQLYLDAHDHLGSPLAATTVARLSSLDADSVDQAVRNIFPLSVGHVPPSLQPGPVSAHCRTISQGEATADLNVPSRGTVSVGANAPGQLVVTVSFLGPAPDRPTLSTLVEPGERVQLTVPDMGLPIYLRLRIRPPANSEAAVCGDWR